MRWWGRNDKRTRGVEQDRKLMPSNIVGDDWVMGIAICLLVCTYLAVHFPSFFMEAGSQECLKNR